MSTYEAARGTPAHTEAYLLRLGVDLSGVRRLESIMGQRVTVLELIDNVAEAEHLCSERDCCTAGSMVPRILRETTSGIGWVYSLLAGDGEILYIGKTSKRLPRRIAQHDESMARLCSQPESVASLEPAWRRAAILSLRPEWISAWCVGDSCHRLEKAAILALQPAMNTAELTG